FRRSVTISSVVVTRAEIKLFTVSPFGPHSQDSIVDNRGIGLGSDLAGSDTDAGLLLMHSVFDTSLRLTTNHSPTP
ncbi:MAG: hypothetical protein ABI876_14570, partial [Bacteroidota bacterium]